MSLHLALLLAIGLFRHWGNMSNLNDLGFFDQAVWGTLHGKWFLDTNNTFGKPINWLGCHFNPFLLLFVPLYAIHSAAEWFVVAQALALSVTAWPIFLLASRVHESEHTGLLWAVIFLFNPFVLSAAAWDFHPVALAVPFIAWALLAVEKKNFRQLVTCCLFLLLIQEQLGITVAGFGALWGLKHRFWRSGLLLTGAGFLHAILVLGVIMPSLSPSGTHSMIVDTSGNLSRYGWMGGSLLEIIGNITFHPVRMLTTVITMRGSVSYIVLLVLPFLGLFFAAPLWLLPAFADFTANMLSAIPMPRAIISYHSVTLVPVLTVAAAYGARRVALPLAGVFTISLSRWVLLFTLVFGYLLAPLPLPGAANFWQPVQWSILPDPVLTQVRALTSVRSSVSVQANVGAHFSQHQRIYRYPYKVGEADAIVLWLDSPTLATDPANGYGIGTISHHLQMMPASYLASVECLLRSPVYNVVFWNKPWLVLARGSAKRVPHAAIQNRLNDLRRSWQIAPEEYEKHLQECGNKRL